MNLHRLLLGMTCSWMLAACAPPEPLKLGYLASLTGRGADLGTAGRNGAQLAIEQQNEKGGINGRPLELLVRDDEGKPEHAAAVVEQLATARVEAIIGPMLSSIAMVVVPVAEKYNLVMVSPTVTASVLSGRDDPFFKVASSTRAHSATSAEFQYARGLRRIAIAYDLANRAYTTDWVRDFTESFQKMGGSVVIAREFTSGQTEGYANVIFSLAQAQPDGLLFVANAVDTVHMIRQAHQQGLKQPLIGVTWAATEQLIELGGRTVEGFNVTQYFNREDTSPAYLAFREAFRTRFQQEPGFASVAAYDATVATLTALQQRGKDQSLKQAILASGPYHGVQEQWNFDRFGDAERKAHVTEVRDGRFVVVK